MKYLIPIFLILSSCVGWAGAVPISVEDDWAPWSGKDLKTNQPIGLSVELVKKQFALANMNVDLKAVPFSRCLIEAESGKTLGCFHTAKTPENEKRFYFPQKPLVVDDVIIVSLKGAPKLEKLSQLDSLRVGVTIDYAYSPEFDSLKGIHREVCKSDFNLLRMLHSGRIKYAAIFKEAFANVLAENSDLMKLEEFEIFPAGKAKFYLAFSKRFPDSLEILNKYNQAAEKIKNPL